MFGSISYAEQCGVFNGHPLGIDRAPCCQIDDINEPECESQFVCNPSNAQCNSDLTCKKTGNDLPGYYYYSCVDPNAVCGGSGEFCCLGEGVERCDSADLECVYDYAVDDYVCKTNHCGLNGERCCEVGDQCETGLTCIHQLDNPEYVCGNLTDYRTLCKDEGDVCCYTWFTGEPNGINLCKTLDIGGNPLSPNPWSDCYCYNGLETSFTAGSCYCQGEDCGKREGYPCCLPADPTLPPYCDPAEKLVCKVGPNTCCEDANGDLACDFACGGFGELCCQRSNPGLGEDEFYCESEDLECVNGYCGGRPREPIEMVYKGPIIDSLDKIINPILKILYYGGLFIGFFFIVLSGYNLMTSQGDPQKAKEAQEQLTSAILGILFILLSVNILRVIIQLITDSFTG